MIDIIGTHKQTGKDVILFTWTRGAEAGIKRAEKDNKLFGNKFENIRVGRMV